MTQLGRQIARFTTVGGGATAVHVLIALSLNMLAE